MSLRAKFLWLWLGGLAVFAITILLSLPLVLTAVPGGILDHQTAGTAARVDAIQAAWMAAGVRDIALASMVADMLHIIVLGLGCIYGGIYIRQTGSGWQRLAGVVIVISAAIFLTSDVAETAAQLIQMVQNRGSDALAGLAATMRPIKVVTWIIAVFGIALILIIRKVARRAA